MQEAEAPAPTNSLNAIIHLGVPTYGDTILANSVGAMLQCTRRKDVRAEFDIQGFSGLTANFNSLYINALNKLPRGFTHFAMMHADIFPEAGWLDKLLEIMAREQADVVSAIVPIKDDQGLTSTALETDDFWRPRRLTLTEVYEEWAPTFSMPNLLLNTGLMLVDIRKPWAKKVRFHVEDKIEEITPGVFKAFFAPEDWNFSRDASKLGAKLVATREVMVEHIGPMNYPNRHKWGTLKRDIIPGGKS